jgi:hypothetical protein
MSEGLASAHDIWSAPPDEAEALLRKRGVSYVMLCPARGKLPIKFSETGLRAALQRGEVPAYLEAVPAGETFKVWRVVP